MDQPLYFGCVDTAGHFLFDKALKPTRLPAGFPFSRIDGSLVPGSTRGQGAAAVHVKDGVTALAAHDYTVDDRPGSNSVFFLPGELSFAEAVAAATAAFPAVVARVGPMTEAE